MGNTDRSFNPFAAVRSAMANTFKPKVTLNSKKEKAMQQDPRGYKGYHSRKTDFQIHLDQIFRTQNIRRYVNNASGFFNDTKEDRLNRLTKRGRSIYYTGL